MRLTLIYPSVGRKTGVAYVRAWQMEPLSMAVLAALTPSDVDLRFYDDRMEPIPYDEPTDLVAISVETFTALRAYRIAHKFRARGVRVILGGYHVTLMPEEAGQQADSIVIGDAESVWSDVLNDVRHDRLQPIYCGSPGCPSRATFPRRDIFSGKKYLNISLIEYTRGCDFGCEFCSVSAFHGARQHHRPACHVAREIEATGKRDFFIVDDNLVSRPERAHQLCRELLPLRVRWVGQASIHVGRDPKLLAMLAKSGCRGLLLGLESLDPVNLRTMGKQWNAQARYAENLQAIRDRGLAVYGTFLFGYDNDDGDTVRESVRFARKHKLFLAAFNHLVPFPGTPLYRRLVAENRLPAEKWWLDPGVRIGDVTFRPKKISAVELQELCLKARRDFYSYGSVLQRMMDFKVTLRDPAMAALFLALNLQTHFDIDRRQGLQLGAGLRDWEAVDEPVPV
jgi:radical SAM superfamily enzyme YgiQ (UPF0313 family)